MSFISVSCLLICSFVGLFLLELYKCKADEKFGTMELNVKFALPKLDQHHNCTCIDSLFDACNGGVVSVYTGKAIAGLALEKMFRH